MRAQVPCARWSGLVWLLYLAAACASARSQDAAPDRTSSEPTEFAQRNASEERGPRWLPRRWRDRDATRARAAVPVEPPQETNTQPSPAPGTASTEPGGESAIETPRALEPGSGGMPTVAEAAAQETKAEPSPYFLQKRLGYGDSPVKIYGWIQNSFTGNTNGTPRDRSNFSVFPNRLANQWQGNQYYLIVENPIEMGDRPNLGFRVDTLFGNDWQFTKDIGLFDRSFHINSFAGLDFPQVYGETHLPILTRGGLDIKGGRWYSPAGFEAVQAVNRPLLSVPYLLNFTPFTFLGAMTTLHLTDRINLLNGTVNGPDRWFDQSFQWGYLGGLAWTSKDSKSTLTFIDGFFHAQMPRFLPADMTFTPTGNPPPPFLAGRINPFYGSSLRRYFSLTGTHKWTDKLTEVLEMEQIFDPRILGFGPTARSISWAGLAHWLLYAFNDKVTGVWRSEAFWDNQGAATGLATTFYEVTLGFNYRPKPWLYIRPEARYDWVRSGHPFNDGTRASQFLLAFDVIVRF